MACLAALREIVCVASAICSPLRVDAAAAVAGGVWALPARQRWRVGRPLAWLLGSLLAVADADAARSFVCVYIWTSLKICGHLSGELVFSFTRLDQIWGDSTDLGRSRSNSVRFRATLAVFDALGRLRSSLA